MSGPLATVLVKDVLELSMFMGKKYYQMREEIESLLAGRTSVVTPIDLPGNQQVVK